MTEPRRYTSYDDEKNTFGFEWCNSPFSSSIHHPMFPAWSYRRQPFIQALPQDAPCLSKEISLHNLPFPTLHWILQFLPPPFPLPTSFQLRFCLLGVEKHLEWCSNHIHEPKLPPLGSAPGFPNPPAWFLVCNDSQISPLFNLWTLFTSCYLFLEGGFFFWMMWKHLPDMMEIYEHDSQLLP